MNHIEINKPPKRQKFSDPDFTAKNEKRAIVPFTGLKTLWINTGTLCNLQCKNCYIESSPKNDRLEYITSLEVKSYIDEIVSKKYPTEQIGFTGGEPFMNPDFIDFLEYCLSHSFECLVLTNAMKPMMNKSEQLLKLKEKYLDQLKIRVSLDHYTETEHEKERGLRTWKKALVGLQWLSQNDFSLSVAGRSITGEDDKKIIEGYQQLFESLELKLDAGNIHDLVVFPEMDSSSETPEITVDCWSILNKKPTEIMCSNSRMLVKNKGAKAPSVAACTLLPYDEEFHYQGTLSDSFQPIKLNHPHCSKFCVLGGGACSQ